MSPLCESYRSREQLHTAESFYSLDLKICPGCLLVQLSAYVPPEEIFGEYAYFSSFSASWLDHARRFAERMIQELSLGPSHRVVEVGSDDGYLLQYFLARNIPVLGIDAIQRSSCPANGILLRRPCPGSMLTPATG